MQEYNDNDFDCQPTMLDMETNRPLPLNHPYMVAIQCAFKDLCTLDDRRAWYRVFILDSKDANDKIIAQRVIETMNFELYKVVKSYNQ